MPALIVDYDDDIPRKNRNFNRNANRRRSQPSSASASSSSSSAKDSSKDSSKDSPKDKHNDDDDDYDMIPRISETFAELVANEKFADVYFSVGKYANHRVRIPAHRQILATASPIFAAMLFPSVHSDKKALATASKEESDIVISDANAGPFKQMLECIYTDHVRFEADDIPDLLYLANKFDVEALKSLCIDFMEDDVTPANACTLMEEGRKLLNDPTFGLAFIQKNTAEVCESKDFLNLSQDSLRAIFKCEELSASELVLFTAAHKWAISECKKAKVEANGDNKRKFLGDVMSYIRFPLFTMAEVGSKVQPCGLLSDDDLLALFTWIGAPEGKKPKTKYISTPRGGAGMFLNTVLIPNDCQAPLLKFLPKEYQSTAWHIIFKASKDGMNANSFHNKVGETKPTIVVIKARTGNVFGGFTTQSWGGNVYKSDNAAFLFSLVSGNRNPKKCVKLPNRQGGTSAIYAQRSYGPTFGSGHNIYINQSFGTNSNYAGPGYPYTPEDNSQDNYDNYAGQYNFTVEDIEVFTPKK